MRRESYLHQITTLFQSHPAVALLGPRQCGKTTLAHAYAESYPHSTRFDLEDPADLLLLENPMLALGPTHELFLSSCVGP